ncbi:helix-turn-helix domain-containing protein [Paenibacillus sp. GCM10027627]|uniref:helix-turn-helix domain-containing protein n=1 Tax=unclassified Paenibacillus TaxID=185978 RepID=UPI0036458692
MSVHQQIFLMLDQPMLILKERNGEVRIDDANEAFLNLVGQERPYLQAINSPFIKASYPIEMDRRTLKSEIRLAWPFREVSVRIEQMPLPQSGEDDWRRSLLIAEDLTAFHWINRQLEKGKVLISGVVDRHLHIRFLQDRLAPLTLEPEFAKEDETLLHFIAENEQERIMALINETAHLKQDQTITMNTSKLSGVELELELTFSPILNGYGICNEVAFVIWDLRPRDEEEVDSGMKLKIWMAKRDMSAGQLSAATGISMQTISKLRNGKIEKPHRLTAELIASELKVDVNEIWPSIRK